MAALEPASGTSTSLSDPDRGSRSHAPQFPATLSLPWILAEHALAEATAAGWVPGCGGVLDAAAGARLADVLLLPFAVHADAAAAALRLPYPPSSISDAGAVGDGAGVGAGDRAQVGFDGGGTDVTPVQNPAGLLGAPWRATPGGGALALGVRHLFAEVKAEAELCWDQLMFRLAAAAHNSAVNAATLRELHPALQMVALGVDGRGGGGISNSGTRSRVGDGVGTGGYGVAGVSEGNGLGPLMSRARRAGRPFTLLGRRVDLACELRFRVAQLCSTHMQRVLSTFESGGASNRSGGGGSSGKVGWGERVATVTGVAELDAALALATGARAVLAADIDAPNPSSPRADEAAAREVTAMKEAEGCVAAEDTVEGAFSSDPPPSAAEAAVSARGGAALEEGVVLALLPGFLFDGVYRRFECPEKKPITIGHYSDGASEGRGTGDGGGGKSAQASSSPGGGHRLHLLRSATAPPVSNRSLVPPPDFLLSASLSHLATHFGGRHADAVTRVLGPRGTGRLATAVAHRVHRAVVHGLGPHLLQLARADAVPLDITLPRQLDEYGSHGVHGYFRLRLRAVASYPLLRAEAGRGMRGTTKSTVDQSVF